MKNTIIAIFTFFVASVCLAQVDASESSFEEEFFEANSPKLQQLALLFLSDRLDHQTLNHIDSGGVGPRNLELSKARLDRYRELMDELNISLVAKGDFSGNNLGSTVYLVREQQSHNEHFEQEGYLLGVNLAGRESSTTGLSLHRLDENWFYFVRKEQDRY